MFFLPLVGIYSYIGYFFDLGKAEIYPGLLPVKSSGVPSPIPGTTGAQYNQIKPSWSLYNYLLTDHARYQYL